MNSTSFALQKPTGRHRFHPADKGLGGNSVFQTHFHQLASFGSIKKGHAYHDAF
jgi:hypothetical protein